MKKIIALTILGLLVYMNVFSQQQATIHGVVTITLPKNVEKLTKEELVAQKPDKGKSSPIVLENFKGETYKLKDILIQLNAASIAPKPDLLVQQKKEIDDLYSFSQPQFYSTSIERLQNHSVLITNFDNPQDSKGYFIFKCYNKSGNSVLIGTLEYDQINKKVAQKNLNQIIQSIKFKKP
ncbi:hypothetical protein WG947_11875 [Pontibacter sp. H259]|uniref:hypothetical protein n=1 Tax=Pontibacter sp. H259 TaxID=3133421 RepID=UPI0030C56C18